MTNCIIFAGGKHIDENYAVIDRTVGPYRIASALQDAGYTVFVLDFTEYFTSDEIIKVLEKHISNETLWVGYSSSFYWPKNEDRISGKLNVFNEMYFNLDGAKRIDWENKSKCV